MAPGDLTTAYTTDGTWYFLNQSRIQFTTFTDNPGEYWYNGEPYRAPDPDLSMDVGL